MLFQFFEWSVFQFFAVFGYLFFDVLEALDEFIVGGAQGFFGIYLFDFGDIDQHEQDVSQLSFDIGFFP